MEGIINITKKEDSITKIIFNNYEIIIDNDAIKKYKLLHKRHYFLNPIYKWKFGWKPRKQSIIIKVIPFVRNFFTTCVYYIIQPK